LIQQQLQKLNQQQLSPQLSALYLRQTQLQIQVPLQYCQVFQLMHYVNV